MSATGKLGIMLVEDHSTFRGVLYFVLNHEPDFEVVAQAGSLAEGREVLGISPWPALRRSLRSR